MSNKVSLGRLAESLVLLKLLCCGYRFLCRNWHCKGGELDLVLLSPNLVLTFIEVKYSGNSLNISAEDNFTRLKRFRVLKAAKYFLFNYPQLSKVIKNWSVLLACVSAQVPKSSVVLKFHVIH